MYNDIERVLISKEQIENRIRELGEQLDHDYMGKTPVFICILKGGAVFYTDLVRAVKVPVIFDFMSTSSYGNKTKSSGEVQLLKDLNHSIEGRHVLIVEDIVDSGYTLSYLKNILSSRKPASLKICTLLDKPSRRETDLVPDYCGFKIDDYFVVGYGLDYDEKYRNMPEICILKPEKYSE